MSFLACDPVTLLCLRRTSRLFLRLFSSPAFGPLWTPTATLPGCPPFAHIWAVPRAGLLTPAQTITLRALLLRDAALAPHLCDACRALRRRPGWPAHWESVTGDRLFCGGCREYHAPACFSAAQRRAAWWVRVCIGLEGHVRLCQHVALSWTTVAALVP